MPPATDLLGAGFPWKSIAPRDGRPAEAASPGGVALHREILLANGIFGFETGDPRARFFQMLRSQVLGRLDRSDARILAVTSTHPRNGKSFIAANLAAALSRIHATWIVDLDLRRPSIAERFGLAPTAGLDDYLLGRDRMASLNVALGESRLTILPVGQARENSAELLASERMAELFAHLRGQLGRPVCIIDTPPVLEGDDLMIVARHVDAVLFVVEEGQTRQPELRECLRMLEPTPILGTVLNRTLLPRQPVPYGQYHAR